MRSPLRIALLLLQLAGNGITALALEPGDLPPPELGRTPDGKAVTLSGHRRAPLDASVEDINRALAAPLLNRDSSE